MNQEIKLNCPMCEQEFTTPRRDKIWCNVGCSNRFIEVKKNIDANKRKHELIKNTDYHYNFKLNKFFIKSLMTSK
jgi:hypothetical protein